MQIIVVHIILRNEIAFISILGPQHIIQPKTRRATPPPADRPDHGPVRGMSVCLLFRDLASYTEASAAFQ